MVAAFKHINCKCNTTANVLEKFGLSLEEGIVFYISPPTFVMNLLSVDLLECLDRFCVILLGLLP